MNPMLIAAIVTMVLLGGGCHRTQIIPERLEGKVDRDLRYADIKDNPQAYQGKLMLAGGQVLSALRKQDGTHIEVLQIPLSENLIPDGHESASKGRFVVIDYGSGQVTDPAIFDKGNTRITVVGKVLGSATVTIDDVQLQVPQLALKHVTVWDWDRVQSGYQPSAGYAYPYGWGYGGFYGSRYNW